MCIIQVKAGMRYPTVTQAFAHNCQTLAQDCDYLLRYIPTHERSRPFADEHTQRVRTARAHLAAAYKLLLACWHDAMCDECTSPPELTSMYDLPDPAETHRHEPTSPEPTLDQIARAFLADAEHTQAHLEGIPHKHTLDPFRDFNEHPHPYPADDPNAAPGWA